MRVEGHLARIDVAIDDPDVERSDRTIRPWLVVQTIAAGREARSDVYALSGLTKTFARPLHDDGDVDSKDAAAYDQEDPVFPCVFFRTRPEHDLMEAATRVPDVDDDLGRSVYVHV